MTVNLFIFCFYDNLLQKLRSHLLLNDLEVFLQQRVEYFESQSYIFHSFHQNAFQMRNWGPQKSYFLFQVQILFLRFQIYRYLFFQTLIIQILLSFELINNTLFMSKLSQGGKPQPFTVSSFIFKEQIGAGKFGIVYRAVQKWSEQEVAIKVILKKTINNVSIYKQLKRQIQIHSRLKHPNICQLYSYFHDSNSIYLVLEYCPHGNLSIPIREQKEKFSQKKIASIFFQLVQAVDYMHKRNVMHRDLKLENILVDSNFNVKIADFGWCIHVNRQRKTLCGTLQYMSPQMLKEEPYRHNIDVYCLGIILYQLFFHKTPFVTNEHITTLKNIADGLFSFDDDFRIISDQAKDLISLMLSKEKDKRPAPSFLLEHPFIKNSLSQRSQQKLDLSKLLAVETVNNTIGDTKQQQDELKANQILKQIQEINEIEDGQQEIQENIVVQRKLTYQSLNPSGNEDYGQIIYPEI